MKFLCPVCSTWPRVIRDKIDVDGMTKVGQIPEHSPWDETGRKCPRCGRGPNVIIQFRVPEPKRDPHARMKLAMRKLEQERHPNP